MARWCLVLVVFGCSSAQRPGPVADTPDCDRWIGPPQSAENADGLYDRLTGNEREGFPCEIAILGAVVVQSCSPGTPEWGIAQRGNSMGAIKIHTTFDHGSAQSAKGEPLPFELSRDGSILRVGDNKCWSRSGGAPEAERAGVGLVGMWQRAEEIDTDLPRRLLITPRRWRSPGQSKAGELEVIETRNGVVFARMGEKRRGFQVSADRRTMAIDGIRFVHESPPVVSCTRGVEVTVGQPASIDIDSKDPDGGKVSLRIRVSGSPKGSSLPATTDEVSGSFVPDVPGEFSFLITATDDEGGHAYCHAFVRAVHPAATQARRQ